MKMLFAHDTILDFDGVNYYSHLLHYDSWLPYLEVFDEIRVCVRSTRVYERARLQESRKCNGPRIHVSPLPGINSVKERLLNNKKTTKLLTQLIKGSDCVVVRLPSEIGLLAAKIARQLGIPHLVEVVGNGFEALWYHGRKLAKVNAPYAHHRMKHAVRHAPYVSYVTQKYLQSIYPSIGKNLACSDARIREIKNSKRQGDVSKDGPFVVGLVAPLQTTYKGIDTAFYALADASKSIPGLELRILGEGSPVRWERLAEDLGIRGRIRFYGTLPSGPEVWEWFDGLTVYIQPSLTEGLPRAVIEAMSRGLPVLATNVGALSELLPEECLFSKGNSDALTKKLRQLYQDREWNDVLAKQNLESAYNYIWESLLDKRIHFWKDFAQYVSKKREKNYG